MKAHLVIAASAAIMLLNASDAAQAKSGNTPKPAAQEFDARTGEWKPARPKPVVQKYAPSSSLPKPKKWSWQRAAMQPLRFIVMAAKVPLIPAGFAAMNGPIIAHNHNPMERIKESLLPGYSRNYLELLDFTPAFENFDPGPAIDEDLERMEQMRRRNDSLDERRPQPLNTRLKIVSSVSIPKSQGAGQTAIKNRPKTTLSVPFNVATVRRSSAGTSPRETEDTSPTVVKIPATPNLDLRVRTTAPGLSTRELGPTLGVDTDLERSDISVAQSGLRDDAIMRH